jgi:hypothetical protein
MSVGNHWGGTWGQFQPQKQPTTVRALLQDFRSTILKIEPTYPEYRNAVWRYAASRRDVQAGGLRTFHIEFGRGASTLQGVQDSGAGEYRVAMRVWTSYSGLADDFDDAIITQDGVDLWRAISYRYLVAPGFFSAVYSDWVADDEEGGRRVGFHEFEILYLQATGGYS